MASGGLEKFQMCQYPCEGQAGLQEGKGEALMGVHANIQILDVAESKHLDTEVGVGAVLCQGCNSKHISSHQ